MKNRSIEVALSLTVLLAVFLFMLSCGQGSQNTTQNAPGGETSALASDEPCSQTTPGAKKDKLRIKILDKIDHDPVLKKQ